MDIVSWIAISAGVLLVVVVWFIDRVEQKRNPNLHTRMPGAIVFAAALILAGVARGA
jgi:uncharacterized BrkB/YihY/UPF0761 family membrane protein